MKRYIRFILLAAIYFLSATASPAATDYSDILIFGDSFSDTGNFGSLPPPYFENRFSNGPVAIELVAQKLGLNVVAVSASSFGNNFAVGVARASGEGPIDLPAQVRLFLTSRNGSAPTDALYVLFIGGNDLRDARDAINFDTGKALVSAASRSVGIALDTLVAAGARHILLINAPNIGSIPETRAIAALTNNPALVVKSRKLSRKYKKQLRRLTYPYDHSPKYLQIAGSDGEVSIIEFDLFRFFQNLLRKSHRYGFTNSTEACINVVTAEFNVGCDPTNIDSYIFLDSFHPTAKVHSLAANAIYRKIVKSRYHWKTYPKWR